jgi:hypothetical protein
LSNLLDTNICIYLVKKKPAIVFDKLNAIAPGQIGISVITFFPVDFLPGIFEIEPWCLEKRKDNGRMGLNRKKTPLKIKVVFETPK